MSNNETNQPSSWRKPGDDAHEQPTQLAGQDVNAGGQGSSAWQGGDHSEQPTQVASSAGSTAAGAGYASAGNQSAYGQSAYGSGNNGQAYNSNPQYGQATYGSGAQGQPYGQPQYAAAGAAGYGQAQPYGQGGYPAASNVGGSQYASWGKRVGAYLLDGLIAAIPFLLLYLPAVMALTKDTVVTENSDGTQTIEQGGLSGLGLTLVGLAYLLSFAVDIWNRVIRQGKTGQSIGKKVLGMYVLNTHTGQPLGAGKSFVRWLVQWALSALTCGIGTIIDHLMPLWDDKKQSIHDKAAQSVVVEQSK